MIPIALIQFAPVFGDKETNLQAIARLARRRRAALYVLPELCTTGYQFRDREELASLAESRGGPTADVMTALARELDAWFVYGFAESDSTRVFNSAALVGPRGLAGVYRKTHLFAREKALFDAGDSGLQVFDTGLTRVGVMICFDWMFPEAARTLALEGAQIIAHPANLVLPWCQQAMVTRALENRVFTATCNRTGREERWPDQPLTFTGQSRLVSPAGQVLAQAGPRQETVLVTTIDPLTADAKNVAGNDLFADRRPAFYRRLCRED